MTREDLSPNGIGIELGVARGDYSNHLLEHSSLKRLYSVDRWAGDRAHDIKEYFFVLERLSKFAERSVVIRSDFKDALLLFPDKHFDFIYIDGYANTLTTDLLNEWWIKLKDGGMFAGHDYTGEYKEVKEAVDLFVAEQKLNLNLTEEEKKTWLIIKS